LFIGGNALNFVSFSMAPQSVLASLSAVQFVSNVFFAWCLLGEMITKRIVLATALIIAGVLVSVNFATHSEQIFTTRILIDCYRIQYTSYLGVQAVSLLIMQFIYHNAPEGASYAPVCFAGVSAIIGTQSAVQAKCVSELIKIGSTGADNGDTYPWFKFVVGGILIASQVFWLVRMQKALAKFDGAIIIPMLQVFWTSLSILTGGLYFKEFIHMTWTQGAFFLSGLGILFVGVYFLVPPKETESGVPETVDDKLRRTQRASVFCGAGFVDIIDLAKGTTEDEKRDRLIARLRRLSRMPSRLVELTESEGGTRHLARRPTEALHSLDSLKERERENMIVTW